MSCPFPTSDAGFHALPDARACTAFHAAGPGRHESCPPALRLASICSALARARVAVYGMYGYAGIGESRSGSRGEKSLRMSSPVTSPVRTAQAALHALPDERQDTVSRVPGTARYASRPPGLWLASICSALARARAAAYGMYGYAGIGESRSGSRGEKSLRMSSPVTSPVRTAQAALHALPDERQDTVSRVPGTGRYASRHPGLRLASICSALACARVAVYKMYGFVGIGESQSGSSDGLEMGSDRSLSPYSPNPSHPPGGHLALEGIPADARPAARSDLQRSGSCAKKRAETFCLVFGHNCDAR